MSTSKIGAGIVQPYLFFDGRCEEAINFYKQAVGAQVEMLMHFKDSPAPPQPGCPPTPADKVMHASIRVGNSMFLASDGHCGGKPEFKGFSLSLTVETDADAAKYFGALSAGGQVMAPLSKTFFSSSFGMLTDKFGVGWMVYVAP